jgi:hypothetical protein
MYAHVKQQSAVYTTISAQICRHVHVAVASGSKSYASQGSQQSEQQQQSSDNTCIRVAVAVVSVIDTTAAVGTTLCVH